MKIFSIMFLTCLLMFSFSACSQKQITIDEEWDEDPAIPTVTLTTKVMDMDGNSVLLASMEEGVNPSDIYWINIDNIKITSMNKKELKNNLLQPGMLVDVTYDGTIQESFPMRLGSISNIHIKEQKEDIVGLYRKVVADLYEVDPGLNDDIEILAFDLTEVSNLSEVEKTALIYLIGNTYKMEAIAGTFDELCEQGYINKDKLYFEKGLLFTIRDTLISGDRFTFNAEKWRSGLGAYYFSDCTAHKTAHGWDYRIGAEMIS